MPLTRKTARVPEPHPAQEQEEEEPGAKRPRLEPVETQPMGQGPSGFPVMQEWQQRPYQDSVEREARDYWQSLGGIGSLTKPTQEEIRAAAMPILCAALRRREGRNEYPDPVRAHHAVGGMIQHALETGRIKPPFSKACESPNYVEALIKLADDANWLAREVPLPNHPPPKHPPIYYTMDSESSRPIPRSDSYLRGDYVYTPWFGSRVTASDRIFPLEMPEGHPVLTANILYNLGLEALYTLESGRENVEVFVSFLERIGPHTLLNKMPLKYLHFSPYPPPS